MTDDFGKWVADEAEIEEFNETDQCVCGEGDVMQFGRFWSNYHCGECERVYISGENEAIHPREILQTDREGLVHASEDWDAFHLLTEKEYDVQDYIEFPPAEAADEAWLWAHDGLYIGYLLYRNGILRTVVILDGYRGEGHGTEFIEQWFDQLNDDEIEIMYFDRTEPFIEQLTIPYESV
jgi:hypothetical protein